MSGKNQNAWNFAGTALVCGSIGIVAMKISENMGKSHVAAASKLGDSIVKLGDSHVAATTKLGDSIKEGLARHLSEEGAGKYLLSDGMGKIGAALERSTPLATGSIFHFPGHKG